MKVVLLLAGFALLAATLVPEAEGLAEAVAEHDRHPGLDHPAEGEGDHQHGDSDDHHETPDSPCHHHEAHSCCHPGPTLALMNITLGFESPPTGFPPLTSQKTRLLPSVRELFHVPLG